VHFTIILIKFKKKLAENELYGIMESGVVKDHCGFSTQKAIETAFFQVLHNSYKERRSNKNRIWKEQNENGKHE
jgi:hypothetical protein